MADGANRKFISDPRGFLKSKIIEVGVDLASLPRIAAAHVKQNRQQRALLGRVANTGDAANSDGSVASGIYDFDLTKSIKTAKRMRSRFGKMHDIAVEVYELKQWGDKTRDQVVQISADQQSFTTAYKKPKGAHPIRAYWAPWSANSGWSVQLGDDADFFFTPTMDGCSLAISDGKNPLVTHGNYRLHDDPTRVSQGRTLQEMTQHHTALNKNVNRTFLKDQYAASHEDKEAGLNNLVTVVGIRSWGSWKFYWQRRRVDASHPATDIVLTDRMVRI